jgi:hypothetical protein
MPVIPTAIRFRIFYIPICYPRAWRWKYKYFTCWFMWVCRVILCPDTRTQAGYGNRELRVNIWPKRGEVTGGWEELHNEELRSLYSSLSFATAMLITVAARPKAWTIFARSNTGVVGSNATRDRDVYLRLLCVCVVLCVGSSLATDWSPVQGVLPTVYRITMVQKPPGPSKQL